MPPSSEVLYEELQRVKGDPKATNARVVNAFERWFHKACLEGRPPDALRKNVANEEERFAAHVINGTEGHQYWDGPQVFIQNDKIRRQPVRWVWIKRHGEISRRAIVFPICGERNCIAIDHLDCETRASRERLYSNDAIVGAAQVYYMRTGKSPTTRDWANTGMRPNASIVMRRFGSWQTFLEKAGLPVPRKGSPQRYSDEQLLGGLRKLTRVLGRKPSTTDWDKHREWTQANNLPRAHNAFVRRFGSWHTALHEAEL